MMDLLKVEVGNGREIEDDKWRANITPQRRRSITNIALWYSASEERD